MAITILQECDRCGDERPLRVEGLGMADDIANAARADGWREVALGAAAGGTYSLCPKCQESLMLWLIEPPT